MTLASPAKPINWIPTLVLYCISVGLGVVVDLLSLFRADSMAHSIAQGLGLLSLPVVIVTLVFGCLLHRACWQALPPPFRCTTPGKAVGYLFIPFYNFYWVFVSVVGLARGYVKLRQATGLPGIRNRVGLGISHAILVSLGLVLGIVPGLASLILIADLVLFILFYGAIAQSGNIALRDYPASVAADIG